MTHHSTPKNGRITNKTLLWLTIERMKMILPRKPTYIHKAPLGSLTSSFIILMLMEVDSYKR